MTPSELKYQVECNGSDSYFFDRKSMKFFGDTMANYGVRSAVVRTNYDEAGNWSSSEGVEVEVWELYRKRAVKCGNKASAFFRKTNFERVHPAV